MKVPFTKDDELGRQIRAQQELNEQDIAASTTADEQFLMQKNEDNADLTRWQQDLDPLIKKMVNKLLRLELNEEGELESVVDEQGNPIEPLCSRECVHNIIALLTPVASQNVINSKFTDEEIYRTEKELEKTIIIDILLTEHLKNGTALTNLSEVKKIFRSCSLPTHFRALGGFEAMNQRQIRTVKELHSQGPMIEPQRKKGIFSF